MATVESTILIQQPPERVFEFVADLANHERMLPSTYSDFRIASERSSGLGARLEYKIGLMGREYPTATEIAVYQPPKRLVERSATTADYTTEWRFTPENGGTRVTMRTDYRPGGGVLGVVLDRVLAQRRTRGQQRQQLDRLKSALESEDPA